jgi:hypothetical protein
MQSVLHDIEMHTRHVLIHMMCTIRRKQVNCSSYRITLFVNVWTIKHYQSLHSKLTVFYNAYMPLDKNNYM